ncbi:hypothetical protein BC830DRAFT_1175505, partial [Chytriomyces sp. MP71]
MEHEEMSATDFARLVWIAAQCARDGNAVEMTCCRGNARSSGWEGARAIHARLAAHSAQDSPGAALASLAKHADTPARQEKRLGTVSLQRLSRTRSSLQTPLSRSQSMQEYLWNCPEKASSAAFASIPSHRSPDKTPDPPKAILSTASPVSIRPSFETHPTLPSMAVPNDSTAIDWDAPTLPIALTSMNESESMDVEEKIEEVNLMVNLMDDSLPFHESQIQRDLFDGDSADVENTDLPEDMDELARDSQITEMDADTNVRSDQTSKSLVKVVQDEEVVFSSLDPDGMQASSYHP